MILPDISKLDDWLARCEADVPALRPACAKSIIWAGEPCHKTDIAVVYIHGFSATGHELRPLPDMIAEALGANLHFARLTGHGQDGDAMGDARFEDWQADVAEALEIGHAIGKRVIVIGCSTGCTMVADALARGATADGLVCISPNFGLTHKVAQTLLDLPMVRQWGHFVAGRERSFDVLGDAHGAYWTTRYPTRAVYTMGDAVRAVRRADLGHIMTPAFFAVNDADQVVSPKQTRKVIARWGGRTYLHTLVQTPDDDVMGHVMAGDVFSPKQTAPLAAAILRWFDGIDAV